MKIIGHRGFSSDYPENSLLSFEKAIEVGVDGIDADIHMSLDGKAFIFHDDTLKRILGKDGSIESHHSEDLKNLDIGSFKDEKFHAQRLPTLDELLLLVNGRTVPILEIKYHKETFVLACKVVAHAI